MFGACKPAVLSGCSCKATSGVMLLREDVSGASCLNWGRENTGTSAYSCVCDEGFFSSHASLIWNIIKVLENRTWSFIFCILRDWIHSSRIFCLKAEICENSYSDFHNFSFPSVSRKGCVGVSLVFTVSLSLIIWCFHIVQL